MYYNMSAYSVFFTDTLTGFAVGSQGTIIKTSDGGINWTSQFSGTTKGLGSVCFINENIGYCAGHQGTIIKTTDGGLNWTNQT